MRGAPVLIALVASCASRAASTAPPPAPERVGPAAWNEDVSSASAPSSVDALIALARSIPAGGGPAQVEDVARSLGSPHVQYYWCRGVGCDDGVAESEATKRTAYWIRDIGADKYMVTTVFCGRAQAWRLGAVAVHPMPNGHRVVDAAYRRRTDAILQTCGAPR
jgi:hypothetical protein